MKRTQDQRAIDRFEAVMKAKGLLRSGVCIVRAAHAVGVSRSTLDRWISRYDAGGAKALRDLPRSGRLSKQTPLSPPAE